MFTKLLGSGLARASDEDLCSQLNHIWSVIILMGMGVMITLVQYTGDPIHCWCPAQMPVVHCNYTKALCWVKANYHFDHDESIPMNEADRWQNEIAYYPWVPWILFAMAVVLKLPHIMWESFMPSSGLNLGRLVSMADTQESPGDIAKVIRIWLVRTQRCQKNVFGSAKRLLGSLGFFWLGRNHRTYLTGLVILVKFVYLLATVGLFFSINLFLQVNFMTYGYDVIDNFLRGIPHDFAVFPTNTICDMRIRQMNNVHTYSIQCILPINLYNKYIFIFLWYWLILLSFVNGYSLAMWQLRLLSPANRLKFVKDHAAIAYRLSLSESNVPRSNAPFGFDNRSCSCGNSMCSGSSHTLQDGTASYSGPTTSCSHAVAAADNEPQPRVRRTNRLSTGSSIFEIPFPLPPPPLMSAIEESDAKIERNHERQIRRITGRMIKQFGHDGVVLFRTLETGVGVVVANRIFQELYEQIKSDMYYS